MSLTFSEGISSAVRNGSHSVNFEIGLVDQVGNSKAFLKDGVEDELMIIGPCITKASKFRSGVSGVLAEAGLEVSINWHFS